jgi:hypothetical protein
MRNLDENEIKTDRPRVLPGRKRETAEKSGRPGVFLDHFSMVESPAKMIRAEHAIDLLWPVLVNQWTWDRTWSYHWAALLTPDLN